MRELRSNDSLVTIPPNLIKQAEADELLVQETIPQLQAFFRFLNLTDEIHLETCLAKVVSIWITSDVFIILLVFIHW
jgi:hypothetical protein